MRRVCINGNGPDQRVPPHRLTHGLHNATEASAICNTKNMRRRCSYRCVKMGVVKTSILDRN